MGSILQMCLLAFLHAWVVCGELLLQHHTLLLLLLLLIIHTCNIPRSCIPTAINMAMTLSSLLGALPYPCLAGMPQLKATVREAPTVPGCSMLGSLPFTGLVAPPLRHADSPVELSQVPYFFAGLLAPFTVTGSECIGCLLCEPRLLWQEGVSLYIMVGDSKCLPVVHDTNFDCMTSLLTADVTQQAQSKCVRSAQTG